MCKTLLLIPSDPTWSDKSLRQSLRRAETGDKEGHLQRTQGRDFVGTATLWRQTGTHYICICKMLKGTLKNLISHSEVMPWLKLSSPRVVLHTVCHHHWLDISIMTSGTFPQTREKLWKHPVTPTLSLQTCQPDTKELAAIKAICCLMLHAPWPKVALEHTKKTTADGQLAWTFCTIPLGYGSLYSSFKKGTLTVVIKLRSPTIFTPPSRTQPRSIEKMSDKRL